MVQRKLWIDLARGLSMLAILVHHTEIYYTDLAIIDYRLYVNNALCTFFFISGYLCYKKKAFQLKEKLSSILRTIVLPYFIFMSLIAFPKAIIHGRFDSVGNVILNIITGRESWFITALAISELIFSILIFLSSKRKVILPIGIIITLICVILFGNYESIQTHNYWNIIDAFLALSFLYMGYIYHQKEYIIQRYCNSLTCFILFLLIIISKYIIITHNIFCYLGPVNIDNYPIFFLDNIAFILLLIVICKLLPNIKPISWMGSHVIVYYFLCGGVPLILSLCARRIGFAYNGNYFKVFAILISVYLCITLLTWLIYRYVPVITGRINK